MTVLLPGTFVRHK